MKIYGLDHADHARAIALSLDLDTLNLCTRGRAVQFRLVPRSARARYARRTANGRRIRACCYHGFRDFIRECFAQGATRVHTAWGDWISASGFEDALPALAHTNIGSEYDPADFFTLCDCEANEAEAEQEELRRQWNAELDALRRSA